MIARGCGIDEAQGFVVRSRTEDSARSYVADECGDEGEAVWKDPELTSCEELGFAGAPGIILRDFCAG